MPFVLKWIKVCAILSNMLADLGDRWDEEFEDDYLHDNYQATAALELDGDPINLIGVVRRELVRDYAVSFNQSD